MIQNKTMWSVCLFFAVVVGGCGGDNSKNQTQNETSMQQVEQQEAAQEKAKQVAARIKSARPTSTGSAAFGGGRSLSSGSPNNKQQQAAKKQLRVDWERMQQTADQLGTGRAQRSEETLEEMLKSSEDVTMVAQLVKEIADVGVTIAIGNPLGAAFEIADLLFFLGLEFKEYLQGDNIFRRAFNNMKAMFPSSKSKMKQAATYNVSSQYAVSKPQAYLLAQARLLARETAAIQTPPAPTDCRLADRG